MLCAYLVIYFQRDEGAAGQRKTTGDLMDEYVEWVEGAANEAGICAVTHTRHPRLATTASNAEGALGSVGSDHAFRATRPELTLRAMLPLSATR